MLDLSNAAQTAMPYFRFRRRFPDDSNKVASSNTLQIPVNVCFFVDSWTIYGWASSPRVRVVIDDPTHIYLR